MVSCLKSVWRPYKENGVYQSQATLVHEIAREFCLLEDNIFAIHYINAQKENEKWLYVIFYLLSVPIFIPRACGIEHTVSDVEVNILK